MSKPPVQPPNYTAIPNVILDAMPSFTDAELRVVLAVCRKTFGWHKERDAISISQLEAITGLSRQGVVNALAPLLDRQIIDRVPDRLTFAYRVLVNEVDQSTCLTSQDGGLVNEVARTSQRTLPEVVNVVDTQKKGNKEKESIAPTAQRTPRKRKTEQANANSSVTEPPKGSARRAPQLGPLATALAELCRLDTAVATKEQMILLHKTAKTFSEAGYTPEQVTAFGAWWAKDWRGRDGGAPTLKQVRDCWGEAQTKRKPVPPPPPPVEEPRDIVPQAEVGRRLMEALRIAQDKPKTAWSA